MRTKKLYVAYAAFLLIVLVLSSTFIEVVDAKSALCVRKCKTRCRKARVNWKCQKNCNICCSKCKCVPRAKIATSHDCPCYKEIKGPHPKCP
ncbi:Gibberellin-regulated protein 8-like protein [Drosera capensis]